jgi:hypothetical protein
MAQILAFAARREVQLLTPEGLRCRIRVRARIAGLRRAEILAVDSEAAELLRAGESHHDVLERCAQLSRALLQQRQAMPA